MNSYLIAHKVRGELAFDVANRHDDMGTTSDPSPWWIIPTSGHRAYPFWYDLITATVPEMPLGLRDHYAPASREPKPKLSVVRTKPASLEELA